MSRRRSYYKALRTQCRGRGTTFRETNESVATRFHALPTPAERTLTLRVRWAHQQSGAGRLVLPAEGLSTRGGYTKKQSGPFGQALGTHASLVRHLPRGRLAYERWAEQGADAGPAIQPRLVGRDTSTASIFASLSNLRSRMISLFYGAVPDDGSTALPAVSLRSSSVAVSRTSWSSSESAPCKAGIISGPPIRARP